MTKFLLPLLLAITTLHADWQSLPPMPVGNGGFACGFIGGKLIVAGGTTWKDDQKLWLDTIWSYDPTSNAWSTLSKLSRPIGYGANAVIGQHLIIAGGSNDGANVSREILCIDATGKESHLGQLPAGIAFASGAARQHELFIVGGATNAADISTFTNTMHTLVIRAPTMAKMISTKALSGSGFGTCTSTAAGDDVFVFGGATARSPTDVTNIDTIRCLTSSKSAKPLPKAIRGITAARLNDHTIYLGGGFPSDDIGFVDEAWLFDTHTLSCRPAKPLPIKAMVHLATDGEWLYCLGGEDRKKHRTDAVWRIAVKDVLAGQR